MMLAFEDELLKSASVGDAIGRIGAPILGRLGGLLPRMGGRAAGQEAGQAGSQLAGRIAGAGAGMGLGAAGGGAIGAGVGGYQGYQAEREQGGGGVGGALTGALKGGGMGAGLGAAAGAGLGASGGRVGEAIAGVAGGAGRGLKPAALARFGQRQLHAVTGLTPGGAPRTLAGGQVNPAYMEAMEKMKMPGLEYAATRLQAARSAVNSGGGEKALTELGRAAAGRATAEEAVGKGMTNLPGMVQALSQKGGMSDAWRLGVKPQWTQQGRGGKALLALPVIGAAQEAMNPDEVEGRGGRAERVGNSIGMGLGYASMPFMPIAGAELASRGLAGAGGGVGRGIDRLVGKMKPKNDLELGNNPGAPVQTSGVGEARVEREFTERALGKAPDMGFGGL